MPKSKTDLNILTLKRLPNDHLNDWFTASLLLLLLGVFPYLIGKSIWESFPSFGNIPTGQYYLFFTTSVILLYTIWCLWTENNFTLKTNTFSKKQNRKLIQEVLKELNWKDYKESNNRIIVTTTSHYITLIYEDFGIYYNIRNTGGPKGRLPYLFGYDTFVTYKFLKKIHMVTVKKAISFY